MGVTNQLQDASAPCIDILAKLGMRDRQSTPGSHDEP
jgi:hypothetical protein